MGKGCACRQFVFGKRKARGGPKVTSLKQECVPGTPLRTARSRQENHVCKKHVTVTERDPIRQRVRDRAYMTRTAGLRVLGTHKEHKSRGHEPSGRARTNPQGTGLGSMCIQPWSMPKNKERKKFALDLIGWQGTEPGSDTGRFHPLLHTKTDVCTQMQEGYA